MSIFKVITPASGLIEPIWCDEHRTAEDLREHLINIENYPPNVIVIRTA